MSLRQIPQSSLAPSWDLHLYLTAYWKDFSVGKRSLLPLKLSRMVLPRCHQPRKPGRAPCSNFSGPCIFLTTLPGGPDLLGVRSLSVHNTDTGWDSNSALHWAPENLVSYTYCWDESGRTHIEHHSANNWNCILIPLLQKFPTGAFHSAHLLTYLPKAPTAFSLLFCFCTSLLPYALYNTRT